MFATLITYSRGRMIATHLPFVFNETPGEYGTLYAHMARANSQSETLGDDEALVTFTGPHAYISPSWYDDRATAPTWDYVAVHCYGTPRVHSEDEAIRNIERLLEVVERGRPQPWSMGELTPQEVRALVSNVVSFEIPLRQVEAKFKLSQGEKRERTAAAIVQLERQGDDTLADYMRAYNGL